MTDWYQDGECRTQGADPDLFISIDKEPKEVTEANQRTVIDLYCNHCAVRLECLLQSLDEKQTQNGVWGGLTERERLGKTKAGVTVKNPRKLTSHVRKALEEMSSERQASGRRVPTSRAWPRTG